MDKAKFLLDELSKYNEEINKCSKLVEGVLQMYRNLHGKKYFSRNKIKVIKTFL